MMNHPRLMPPDLPGYELDRLIGLGGMGEVHLATQMALNRQVAVKFLTKTTTDPSDDYEERFRREAELMARVSHPNVVTIFDYGTSAGRAYLVMEYIEGGDLRSRMIPDLPMDLGKVRAIMKPVARAVQHLHSRGIVHRDMKPENILMHLEETPKVTDFGVAVVEMAMGTLTQNGQALGTLGYVAPEQQYGLKIDARADQYSLAAICYELVTGRKALGAFPPPERLNPKLGPMAGSAILRALSEDASDRFDTIGEFGEALDRGLEVALTRGPSRGQVPLGAAIVASLIVGLAARFVPWPAPKPVQQFAGPLAQVNPEPPARPAAWPALAGPNEPPKLTTKSLGITLVKVPSGTFWMGSIPKVGPAWPDESPRHSVRISKPFYLGEKEVTFGQFKKYIAATNAKTSAEIDPGPNQKWGGHRFNPHLNKMEQDPSLNWRSPGLGKDPVDEEPVVQISWDDAWAFCNWLSLQEGRLFRLPTEAEWEYACRAGSEGNWCFGDDSKQLDHYAWNIKNAGHALHPVGTKAPNLFGLFDMHGNAWEWCSDEYHEAYPEAPAIDPQGPPPNKERVIRGGSFDFTDVERTRSAARNHFPPSKSYVYYGFRVCSPDGP